MGKTEEIESLVKFGAIELALACSPPSSSPMKNSYLVKPVKEGSYYKQVNDRV